MALLVTFIIERTVGVALRCLRDAVPLRHLALGIEPVLHLPSLRTPLP
jgi:hypothetical protein